MPVENSVQTPVQVPGSVEGGAQHIGNPQGAVQGGESYIGQAAMRARPALEQSLVPLRGQVAARGEGDVRAMGELSWGVSVTLPTGESFENSEAIMWTSQHERPRFTFLGLQELAAGFGTIGETYTERYGEAAAELGPEVIPWDAYIAPGTHDAHGRLMAYDPDMAIQTPSGPRYLRLDRDVVAEQGLDPVSQVVKVIREMAENQRLDADPQAEGVQDAVVPAAPVGAEGAETAFAAVAPTEPVTGPVAAEPVTEKPVEATTVQKPVEEKPTVDNTADAVEGDASSAPAEKVVPAEESVEATEKPVEEAVIVPTPLEPEVAAQFKKEGVIDQPPVDSVPEATEAPVQAPAEHAAEPVDADKEVESAPAPVENPVYTAPAAEPLTNTQAPVAQPQGEETTEADVQPIAAGQAEQPVQVAPPVGTPPVADGETPTVTVSFSEADVADVNLGSPDVVSPTESPIPTAVRTHTSVSGPVEDSVTSVRDVVEPVSVVTTVDAAAEPAPSSTSEAASTTLTDMVSTSTGEDAPRNESSAGPVSDSGEPAPPTTSSTAGSDRASGELRSEPNRTDTSDMAPDASSNPGSSLTGERTASGTQLGNGDASGRDTSGTSGTGEPSGSEPEPDASDIADTDGGDGGDTTTTSTSPRTRRS